jgi:hypothetical protein
LLILLQPILLQAAINEGSVLEGSTKTEIGRTLETSIVYPKSGQNRSSGADHSYNNTDESDTSGEDKEDRRPRAGRAVAAGETTTHVQSDLGSSMELIFEILIVKVPLLQLHGIQFKKVNGGTWQYKSMAQTILSELRL